MNLIRPLLLEISEVQPRVQLRDAQTQLKTIPAYFAQILLTFATNPKFVTQAAPQKPLSDLQYRAPLYEKMFR